MPTEIKRQRTRARNAFASTVWNNTAATDTAFTVGTDNNVNSNGGQYVAYIFAHDDSADGIIQCGTFTTNGSGVADVTLGWEPQYLLYKRTDAADPWTIFDTARGFDLGSTDKGLYPNSSAAEDSGPYGNPKSNGFDLINQGASRTFVYLAIRKGLMRPPTDASKVFDIVARTGTGAAATITTPGIKTGPDLAIGKQRNIARNHSWQDRLRGTTSQLNSDATNAEGSQTTAVTAFNMDGVTLGSVTTWNQSGGTYINYFFKQARGFFDIVGYTGTGVARTVPHNLGAVPELMIIKNRSSAVNWSVYYGSATDLLFLNLTNATGSFTHWNNLSPTEALINLGSLTGVNGSGSNYIAYLFASCPGVSKIGTYIGTGAAQNIDCGFAAGARFVMIKRIDSTGNWRYADSTRGIISGSDPYLLFNSTAAEVTSADYLAPLSSGFTVNGSDSDVNASGGTYLYFSVS